MQNKKEKVKLLSKNEEENILNAFNSGVFNQEQLDALSELDSIISPKALALSICRSSIESTQHSPFLAKEDKKQQVLMLNAIQFFVRIIDDTQTV